MVFSRTMYLKAEIDGEVSSGIEKVQISESIKNETKFFFSLFLLKRTTSTNSCLDSIMTIQIL